MNWQPGPFRRAAMGLYGLIWSAAGPVLRRHARLADGFAERCVPDGWATEQADVWLQAASGGEARLAGALTAAMRDLVAEQRGTTVADHPAPRVVPRILATTWTRQGLDLLRAQAEACPALYLCPRFVPFDAPGRVRSALQQARPRLLVLLETELWPGLMHAATEAGVPVLILNGRMTCRTERSYRRWRGFWQAYAPAHIVAVSATDAVRYAAVFPHSPVQVLPNIKFDLAVPGRPEGMDTLPGTALVTDGLRGLKPVLLLASVREEEEAALAPAIERLSALIRNGKARLVVAPRHLQRVCAWQQRLEAAGLEVGLRSRQADVRDKAAIVWDAFGEMEALYRAADIAFVGGSLAPLGGQNFLEPLAAGLVPFVGPYTGNFDWALDAQAGASLEALGLLRRVPDALALADGVEQDLAGGRSTDDQRQTVQQRFADWLRPRQGGARQQARLLLDMLAACPAEA